MKTADAILVIGATGTTGSRTARKLATLGHRVKAASRDGTPIPGAQAVRFDWYDRDTHLDALGCVDRVYLVAPPGDFAPAAVMRPFLRLAVAAGVRRAVLLSSSAIAEGGPGVGAVHHALPGLFDQWAVLRPSWFMQNFVGEHLHANSIRGDGCIWTATGSGRVGFIDANDIAAVAVHALTDDPAPNAELILTGPEALTYDEIATIITEVTGRTVIHHGLSVDQMRSRLETVVPPDFAAMLADMDRAIAEEAEDRTTDTVERITGRLPRTFRALLEMENPWNS